MACVFSAKAQPYFSRLYTNDATASTCHYVLPHGASGDFMIAGDAKDSTTGTQGIYFQRLNKDGEILKRGFYNLADYPARFLLSSPAAITRINDNRYVLAGTVNVPDCCKYGFLLEFDSNCVATHYEEILMPFCGSYDSFMHTSAVSYDPKGYLLVLNHVQCGYSALSPVLMKYDTTYNLIWSKKYTPGLNPLNSTTGLIVENDGYVLLGGTRYSMANEPLYRCQATLLKVDTGGVEQWNHRSTIWEVRSYVYHAIKTKDGGYLYLADGHVINVAPKEAPVTYLMAKGLLVKLDAAGNFVWEKELDKNYSPYAALGYQKLLELPDGNIMVERLDTDSIGKNDWDSYPSFQKFSKDGDLLWKQRFPIPKDVSEYTPSVNIYDFARFDNGDLIFVSTFLNTGWFLPPVIQKGWIIKTNSEACFGADDTACHTLSVPNTPINNTFKVYPNPADDYIDVEGVQPGTQLRLFNVMGKEVFSGSVSGSSFRIPINGFSSGMYMLQILDGNAAMVKIIKQ